MKKIWFFYGVLVSFILFNLVSCRQSEEMAAPKNNIGGYTVIDATGTQLQFMEKPKRIISATISTDEILVDLVPKERIVALSYLADKPEISNIVEKSKQIKGKINIRYAESIVELAPDLVIVASFVAPEIIQTLRDMNIPVYVYKTQNTIEDVKNSILELGVLVGEPKQAELMILQMDQKLAEIAEKLKNIPDKSKKRVVNVGTTGIYYRPNSSFNDICEHAKIKNAVMELGYKQNSIVPQEELVRLNPELILLTDYNYDGQHEVTKVRDSIKNAPSYQTIDAVKNNQIVILPGNYMLSLSHHIVYAVEDVAKAAYPDCFD